MDEDDECMESDFHTLQKEEFKSSRAGKAYFTFNLYLCVNQTLTYTFLYGRL